MKRFFSRKRNIVIVAIAILVIGGYFWRRSANAPTYTPYAVTENTLTETLELSGKVGAESIATLRFGAGGLVTYVGAKEGDTVKKWQTLASLDTRQLQKVLEQKLNLYAIQRGTFEQTIDDNDNSVPDGDLARELQRLLAKNQYQLDNTVRDVEYQDLSLRLSRLYSPLEGILVQAPTNVANVQVAPTDTWVVVDPSTLEFVADLDETDLAKVKVGQKVIVVLDAFEEREIESEITKISYTPKETSTGTTYQITIPLTGGLEDLRLGLNGTARVILGVKENVLTLPAQAISIESAGTLVYLKEGSKYVTQLVTLGIDDGDQVEIKTGVDKGATVYVKNSD